MATEKFPRWSFLGVGLLLVVGIVVADLLFSKPTLHNGVIVEMIFIPRKTVTTDIAYSRVRTRDYFLDAQKHDQWVAMVRNETGELVPVHCSEEHYNSKKVGDPIQYKKYQGRLIHIKYFSHNEEL